MPIHGPIHDGQLQACPSCLLGLMYACRIHERSQVIVRYQVLRVSACWWLYKRPSSSFLLLAFLEFLCQEQFFPQPDRIFKCSLRPLHGHCLHTLHVLSFFAIQFLKNSIVATSHHNVTPQRAPSLQHRNITSQCNKLHCCNTAMQCRSEFHRYDAVAQRRPSLQCHVYHHYKAHGHYSWQPPHYQTSCYNVTTVSSCCIAKCHVVSRCNQHLINVTVDIIFDIRSNVVL